MPVRDPQLDHLDYDHYHFDHLDLLDEEAVGVAAGLRAEDGEDEGEEESEEGQADHGEDTPLAHVALAVAGLDEHDVAADNEAVDHHHEISLQHKLALGDDSSERGMNI